MSNVPSFQDQYDKNMKNASQAETNINTVMEDGDEIDLTKSGSSKESKSNPEEKQQKQTETGQNSPHSTSPFSGSGPEDEDCNGNKLGRAELTQAEAVSLFLFPFVFSH